MAENDQGPGAAPDPIELVEVELVEVDDPTPASAFFGDEGDGDFVGDAIREALPRHSSDFRATLPGPGTPGTPNVAVAPLSRVRNLSPDDLAGLSPSVFRAPTPYGFGMAEANEPPPNALAESPTGNPEIDAFLAAVQNAPPPAEAVDVGDEFAFPSPLPPFTEEITEVIEGPNDSSEIRRHQWRMVSAILGVLLTIAFAVFGIQMGARLTGCEKRGPGGALADLITDRNNPRARRTTPARPAPVVATVRHTPPPTKVVVAQRPVQAPVPQPISPPRAPTPQPPPVVVVTPTAPPTPPPVAVVPDSAPDPAPTAALSECRTNGSFASEAEAVRQGYTFVVLFPGQTRNANTPVCRPE